MHRTIVFACLPALLLACGRNDPQPATADPASGGWETFGAALDDGAWTPASDVLASPADFDGETVRVEGTVDEVCKVKGCWLTVRDGDRRMRVKFLDYGFFVPKDCEGRTVRMEGTFAVKTIPEADARHYLEDAGRTEEAAQLEGDQQELTLVARGVRLSP